MGFNDIFRSGFLERIGAVSIGDAALALVIALVLGIAIFLVYSITYSGVMCSMEFGATLIAITMITTFVILAVTSNVVLSLGMVGALSIVRFRAAIKEPIEIAFLFWAIAVGIVIGAGLLILAFFGSALIGVTLVVYHRLSSNGGSHGYILIIRCGDIKGILEQRMQQMRKNRDIRRYKLKSDARIDRPSAPGEEPENDHELIYEVRVAKIDILNEIRSIKGVHNAQLVSYHGEYV